MEADTKAIAAGQMPESLIKVLNKAKDAVNKLLKQGGSYVQEPKLQDKLPVMREAYKVLSGHLADIDSVLTLEELPNGKTTTKSNLEEFMCEVAVSAEKYNGEMESARGFLNSKKTTKWALCG